MIEINGMAHVILSVSRFEESRAFYKKLLPFLGLEEVFDGDEFVYHVGARTALGIQRCSEGNEGQRFEQGSVGLHHLCFRARARDDVDKVGELLREMGAVIDRGPIEGPWAPGYYYIVFEDPDGIRLEINYVPGKGLLAEEAGFDGDKDYA
jgi:catechol 2,3-dioxygenase-like lactoylglutathione lyase family enzyme